MKKSLILTMLILFLMMFSHYGCMSPSGITVTVIENFNAIWLLQGVWWNDVLQEIHQEYPRDKVVIMQYYVDSRDDLPYPRLACSESENRMSWYMKDKGLCTAFFNGEDYIKGIPSRGDINDDKRTVLKKALLEKIQQHNAIVPPVQIWATCAKQGNENEYLISLSVKACENISFNAMELKIALIEMDVPYEAINGLKNHYLVFREFIKPAEITETTGIPLSLHKTGDLFQTEFAYKLNSDLYKNDLSIILFVQDMETKSILQGLEIEFNK